MGDDGSATDGQDGSPTTADAIVAALEALGVERAFAYPVAASSNSSNASLDSDILVVDWRSVRS